jgi:membrane protein
VAGAALWLAASAGFSFYLDNFASYNRVYGTLGAAVAFLVWAWLVNLALLVGVEVNRDLERRRVGVEVNRDLEPRRGGDSAEAESRGEAASV